MTEHLAQLRELLAAVAVGAICAFIGSFAGRRILQKITLRTVQTIVAVAMLVVGSDLAAGADLSGKN